MNTKGTDIKTTVGVYGASGTTGVELVRLLCRHPRVDIRFCTSRQFGGQRLTEVDPAAAPILLQDPKDVDDIDVDVVFLCLPHGTSAPVVENYSQRSRLIIDLSGDLRLRDSSLHQQVYATKRSEELVAKTVYGLTELQRSSVREAKIIANPGCYPTCAGLALAPLMANDLIVGIPTITAFSGVSGAGRGATPTTHFCSISGDVQPYKVGRSHRHTYEIEQILGDVALKGKKQQVIFSPHLVPLERGMLATITVESRNADMQTIRSIYEKAYQMEPFVEVLPAGKEARMRGVVGTNRASLSLHAVEGTNHLIICSAIDNLGKGAAGQALQNMNVALGFEEKMGLVGCTL